MKDDMMGTLTRETLERAKDALFTRTPWYDELKNLGCLTHSEQNCYESLKKGGNKMTKVLYHVILFNKKTESIDFKEYIPAKNEADALMRASQTYGEYDSNAHLVIVKEIQYSGYEVGK